MPIGALIAAFGLLASLALAYAHFNQSGSNNTASAKASGAAGELLTQGATLADGIRTMSATVSTDDFTLDSNATTGLYYKPNSGITAQPYLPDAHNASSYADTATYAAWKKLVANLGRGSSADDLVLYWAGVQANVCQSIDIRSRGATAAAGGLVSLGVTFAAFSASGADVSAATGAGALSGQSAFCAKTSDNVPVFVVVADER